MERRFGWFEWLLAVALMSPIVLYGAVYWNWLIRSWWAG